MFVFIEQISVSVPVVEHEVRNEQNQLNQYDKVSADNVNLQRNNESLTDSSKKRRLTDENTVILSDGMTV